MKKSKKNFGKTMLAILGIVSAWLVISSVIGIVRPINDSGARNIGDRVEISPQYVVPIYTYESPFTGHKDYYYAVFSRDSEYACLVKNDSSWAENFNEENWAAITLIYMRGTVKKFRTPQEMKSMERDIAKYGVGGINSDYYIDLTAERQYSIRLAAGMASGAVCVILAAVFLRKHHGSTVKEERECKERKSLYVVY